MEISKIHGNLCKKKKHYLNMAKKQTFDFEKAILNLTFSISKNNRKKENLHTRKYLKPREFYYISENLHCEQGLPTGSFSTGRIILGKNMENNFKISILTTTTIYKKFSPLTAIYSTQTKIIKIKFVEIRSSSFKM